jgi:hypothetical protein
MNEPKMDVPELTTEGDLSELDKEIDRDLSQSKDTPEEITGRAECTEKLCRLLANSTQFTEKLPIDSDMLPAIFDLLQNVGEVTQVFLNPIVYSRMVLRQRSSLEEQGLVLETKRAVLQRGVMAYFKGATIFHNSLVPKNWVFVRLSSAGGLATFRVHLL